MIPMRLHCGDAAVHRDDRPGQIGPRPRGQVDGGARHVVGSADALERRVGRDLLTEGVERGRHHLGLERPGRDGVDGDGGSQALGQVAGELVHGRLARRVRVRLEQGHRDPVDGPDVDDPGRLVGGAGRLEERHQELGQVEDALDVQRQHLFEGGLVELGQRGAPGGAGVVDQDVQALDPRGHLVGQAAAPASVDRSAGMPMQVPLAESSAATSAQASALRDEM
jgi:hypothetical protein